MISRKKPASRLLHRALAKIRSIDSCEDSAGDLSEDCREIYANTDNRRLTITKKSVEREDWRVVACQSVPLSHFHRITRVRRDSGCQELLHWDRGHELFYQSNKFCFEDFCYLLCPCYQFFKEFPDHCNNEKKMGGYLNQP